MADAPKCAGHSQRSGRPCGRFVGRRPDGLYTRHCWYHGGKQEALPPGHPERGGRPPTKYIDVRLTPEVWRDFHDAALADVGKLDEELAVLRTNLARFKFSEATEPTFSEDQRGRIEREHVDGIARVEERRARILTLLQNLDQPPDPVRIVLDGGGETEIADDARQRLRDKLLREED